MTHQNLSQLFWATLMRHLNLNTTYFVLCGKKMLLVVNENIGLHSV